MRIARKTIFTKKYRCNSPLSIFSGNHNRMQAPQVININQPAGRVGTTYSLSEGWQPILSDETDDDDFTRLVSTAKSSKQWRQMCISKVISNMLLWRAVLPTII